MADTIPGLRPNLNERLDMSDHICAAVGCERDPRTRGNPYCNMHYLRLRRTGSLDVPRPLRPSGRGVCAHPACEALDHGQHGYCNKHWTRIKRHGDPDVVAKRAPRPGPTHPLWMGDDVGFAAVHRRLRFTRGSASLYECVDCAGSANHWSYNHQDPREKQSEDGPYSTNLTFYEPRCVSCHHRFDHGVAQGR